MDKPDLALFDFDGTITTRDSFLLFLQKSRPFKFWISAFSLAPQIALFLSGRYENERLKTDFLKALFAGEEKEKFITMCQQFHKTYCSNILRKGAIEEIELHKSRGATVVVVTASPRVLVESFTQEYGLRIIGTELDFDDKNHFKGTLAGKNCRGPEKVSRIREQFELSDFGVVHCYGDSDGDREMLQLASHQHRHYKPFRT